VRSVLRTILNAPKGRTVVSLVAGSLLPVGIIWFQSSLPKYHGKTVDDWLTFYARNDSPVAKDVVQAFGIKALPTLEWAFDRPTRLRSLCVNNEKAFLFLNSSLKINRRCAAAAKWARLLYSREKKPFLASVKSPRLLLPSLSEAPQFELEQYVNQSTNIMLKTNAHRALLLRELFHEQQLRDPYFAR
jgi:hypothetical protein